MKEALILEHKTFISAKRASEIFGYASDYVGQLCRAGKLDCKMVGRSWFVSEESIKKHQMLVTQVIESETPEAARLVPKKKDTLVFEVPVVKPSAPVVVESKPATRETPVQIPPLIKSIFQPPARINYHVVFVPQVFALPYAISESYLFAPTYPKSKSFTFSFAKFSLATTVFAVTFFFMFQSFLPSNNLFKNISLQSSASVVSAAEEIGGRIISFFTVTIPELAHSVLGTKAPVLVRTETRTPEFNGLAVVPSSNSVSQDEVMKQQIRDSFSDEIQIRLDESGTAGIITPIFRKAKGDDFVYVLVPFNNQK